MGISLPWLGSWIMQRSFISYSALPLFSSLLPYTSLSLCIMGTRLPAYCVWWCALVLWYGDLVAGFEVPSLTNVSILNESTRRRTIRDRCFNRWWVWKWYECGPSDSQVRIYQIKRNITRPCPVESIKLYELWIRLSCVFLTATFFSPRFIVPTTPNVRCWNLSFLLPLHETVPLDSEI